MLSKEESQNVIPSYMQQYYEAAIRVSAYAPKNAKTSSTSESFKVRPVRINTQSFKFPKLKRK